MPVWPRASPQAKSANFGEYAKSHPDITRVAKSLQPMRWQGVPRALPESTSAMHERITMVWANGKWRRN
jgi:hypothetical protein